MDDVTLPPADEFMDAPTLGLAPTTAMTGRVEVPGYEILDELGRGGMGVVYKARQLGLNRLVALKMILSGGHASAADLLRFRTEAEAIARLQHPNIIQVYEIDEHDGRPFFSLEFCPGGSLDRILAGKPLAPLEAAALVEQLARAMAAAHQVGIVHRDLKPANVLLQEAGAGAAAIPKITDFGLAKKLGDAGQTQSGSIMGTPSYMAPEQAEGKTNDIGPACDIYALGAILYELLSGRPPFRSANTLDTILQVVSQEPVPLRRLLPGLPRDLEVICLKCLEKSPAARYGTAVELAEELAAFQRGEPIRARPLSSPARLWRWCKRKPVIAGLLALVALLVLGVTITAPLIALHQTRLRGEAEESERRAKAAALQAEASRASLEREQDQAIHRLYATRVNLAHREWHAGNVGKAEALLESCPYPLRHWEWHYVKQLCNADTRVLRYHSGMVRSVIYSPDGQRLATLGGDERVCVWDVATGVVVLTIPPMNGGIRRLEFAPNNQQLALAGNDGTATIWDLDKNFARLTVPSPGRPLVGIGWAREGNQFWTAYLDGSVKTWDAATGKEVAVLPRSLDLSNLAQGLDAGQGVCASPNGQYLAVGGTDARVRVWDARTGARVLEEVGHLFFTGQPAFSPDNKLVASPGGEGTIKLWDLATGKEVRTLGEHNSYVMCVAFSPDGKWLASGSKDFTIKLWEVESGQELVTLRGHQSEVWGLMFSPDGKQLASASPDGTIKLWHVGPRVYKADHVAQLLDKATSGTRMRAGSMETLTFQGHLAPNLAVAFSRDGRRLASASAMDKGAGNVRVWDLTTRQVTHSFTTTPGMMRLAFNVDGTQLLSTASVPGRPGQLAGWALDEATTPFKLGLSACADTPVHVSPDGQLLALVQRFPAGPSQVEVRATTDGRLVRTLEGADHFLAAHFTPDGGAIVAATQSGWFYRWDVASGKQLLKTLLEPRGLTVSGMSNTALLATADVQAAIQLWDATTGQPLKTLEGHIGSVTGLSFSPDGKRLVSCGSDLTVKVWDVANELNLLTFRVHRLPVRDVVWSRDGQRIASCGGDGYLQVWEVAPPEPAPDTSTWPLVYQDNFNRDAPGADWIQALGTWSIVEGSLRGELADFAISGARLPLAMLVLSGAGVPETAEIRCDCWVADPLALSLCLIEPKRSTQPSMVMQTIISTAARPFGKGCVSLLMRQDQPIGRPSLRPLALEPGKKYQVRMLRQRDRLTFSVDGREVFSERMPAGPLPAFGFLGSWGQPGQAVFFDNLEIRAPETARADERLRHKVDQLFTRLQLKQRVRQALQADSELTPDERRQALVHLDRQQEDLKTLETAAWKVLVQAEQPAADYELAAEQVETAWERGLRSPDTLVVRAWGCYRTGKHEQARTLLEVAVQQSRRQEGTARPSQAAALALVYHRLGDHAASRRQLQQLRDLLLSDFWTKQPDTAKMLAEVTHVLGQHAELSAEERTAEAIKKRIYTAQQAGWLQHNLDAYLAVRSATCIETRGRLATPEPHDATLNRAQLEALRKLMYAGKPPAEVHMGFAELSYKQEGDRVTLSGHEVIQWLGGYHFYGHVYHLQRTAEGWQIVTARSWKARELDNGTETVYSAVYWKERDRLVDQAAKSGEPRAHALALENASRMAEALPLWRQLTAGSTNAADWGKLGEAAVAAGAADEARRAFTRARQLDPNVVVPYYMQGQ